MPRACRPAALRAHMTCFNQRSRAAAELSGDPQRQADRYQHHYQQSGADADQLAGERARVFYECMVRHWLYRGMAVGHRQWRL